MIDPKNIVRYNYTDNELEELLIFCVAVAGKPADRMAKAVDEMLQYLAYFFMVSSPFELLRTYSESFTEESLKILLRKFKITPDKMKARAISELLDKNFNLREVTVEELESIHGIAEKTARFFVMCSRPNVRYAALDTHILRWLYDNGLDFDLEKTLKSRPKGKRYRVFEQEFLNRVPVGMSPAEFDLQIWNEYSSK